MTSLTPAQSQALQLAILQSLPLPSSFFPDASSSSSSPAFLARSSTIIKHAQALIDADFSTILLSEEAKLVVADSQRCGISDLWDEVGMKTIVEEQKDAASAGVEDDLLDLTIAIACLHSFIQLNWTGPSLSFTPFDLFPSSSYPNSSPDSTTSSSTGSVSDEKETVNVNLHNATIPLLSSSGEPAYHLCQHPTFLLLALRILNRLSARERARAQTKDPKEERIQTVDWWLLRAELVHQSILDEAVPLPLGLMESVEALEEASTAVSSENAYPPLPLDSDALATLHTTLGLASFYTSSSSSSSISGDKLAQRQFLAAGRASGLEWELTGAMGKRTKFQVREMSQLVLLARSRDRVGEGEDGEQEKKEEVVEGDEKDIGSEATGQQSEKKPLEMPETLALNDDTLLEQTEYTSSSMTSPANGPAALPSRLVNLNPQSQPALHPLDQSLILCMCLAQHNTTPENGLTASQMSPYLNRVISHPRNWSIHTTALLLRARLEAKRSRTVERSALQLQALVEQMPTADSKASERLKYFHQIPLPSKWEMEKELAQRFLSLGVVRSALEIFQRLEMWEEAVRCYVSMEETDKAIRVVRDLLDGKKEEQDIKTERLKLDGKDLESEYKEKRRLRMDNTRQAKLWCLLADLQKEHAEEYYNKAWEISGHTSSRSQRSLGGLYLAKEQYAKAIPYFEAALKINPLYARTWFALGCCLVREERWLDAREAFSRNVGIEEEDGEAWNNLAAVYLRLDENASEAAKRSQIAESDKGENVEAEDETDVEKSVPFENKRLAFRALQQGLRFSRENWRMWQNFMVVAVDVGELAEAARALGQIVERQARKNSASGAVDEAVLSKLVDAVTREDWNGGKGDRPADQPMTSNEGLGLLPIVDRLFDEVILPKVSDSPKIFVIQARLMRWREDWSGALECYLRAWRCGPANDEKVERDLALFKEVAVDLEELIDLMRNLGPRAHEQEVAAGLVKGKAKWSDWRFSARTLVRTFMGRTKDSFETEPEFERLKEVVADLRK